MDEFRISKGIAHWNSDFTPPAEEYTRDDNTLLLLHFTEEEFDAGSEKDNTDPATEPPTGSVSINGGTSLTDDTSMTLTLSVTDNLTVESAVEMAISVAKKHLNPGDSSRQRNARTTCSKLPKSCDKGKWSSAPGWSLKPGKIG